MRPKSPSASLRRQQELFLAALERTSPGERKFFLDAACGSDVALRQRVERLLWEAEHLEGFMDQPVLLVPEEPQTAIETGDAAEELSAPITERPGDQIGRYQLLEKIGEGGCGVVYRADQTQPLRREVALKIIKLGMDTRRVISRFEAERQTLALMDHPNIAQVFDAGATDLGRPYFVMELVQGRKLTSHCDQLRLGIRERLRLFIQVCQAIQHAHQKGVIHRDIKPSNILVAVRGGNPVPKIIDFGIAKAVHQPAPAALTALTGFSPLMGTPAYMSPEQVAGNGTDIDTRSDIYSLGVVLYELLTGRTPFDGTTLLSKGVEEYCRTIREVEPTRPSAYLSGLPQAELNRIAQRRRSEAGQLVNQLRRDLDWVVMKALEKDRTRRYATASELAQDLEHYLASEPVLARPPSNLYRLHKLVRRRRATCVAAATTTLALLLGIGFSSWQALRATRAETQARLSEQMEIQLRRQADLERERAKEQAVLAGMNEYVADINLAQHSLVSENYGRAVHLLHKHQPHPGEADLTAFEWRYLWQLSQGDAHAAFPTQPGAVRVLEVSPTAQWLALGAEDGLKIWELQSRTLIRSFPERLLAAAFCAGGRELVLSTPRDVRIINTKDWSERSLPGAAGGLIAASKEGSLLATRNRDGVHIWDTSSWRLQTTLAGAFPPVAFSPDGRLVAADSPAGIAVWDLADEKIRLMLKNSQNLFRRNPREQLGQGMAFGLEGRLLLAPRNFSSEQDGCSLGVWDVQTGEEIAFPSPGEPRAEHSGMIAGLAVSPDGNTVATASMDHSVRLWDLRGRRCLGPLHGHLSEVWTVAFVPDGQTLISGAKDGSVNLWAMPPKPKPDFLAGPYWPITFAKDSSLLAILDGQRAKLLFVDPATYETKEEFALQPTPFRGPPRFGLSADLQVVVEGLENGNLKLSNRATGETATWEGGEGQAAELVLSPDGRQLIIGGFRRPFTWWDLPHRTNSVIGTDMSHALFSPEGSMLALYGGTDAELWDVATHSRRVTWKSDAPLGPRAAFSPDGRLLAIASDPFSSEQAIRVWETATGRLVGTCTGHKQGIMALSFSADGRTLASASHDSTLRLWSVATMQELLSLPRAGRGTSRLLFSPNGELLVGDQSLQHRGLRFYSAPHLHGSSSALD